MLLQNFSSVGQVIISIAVMLLSGYLMSRVTKKLKLPNVTGYIIAGIIIGPYCIDVIPTQVVEGMSFLADIALAFIAFSTGEFFTLSTLKKNGAKNVVITVFEALLASLVVFLVMYFTRIEPCVLNRFGCARRGNRACVHNDDNPSNQRKRRFCGYALASCRA